MKKKMKKAGSKIKTNEITKTPEMQKPETENIIQIQKKPLSLEEQEMLNKRLSWAIESSHWKAVGELVKEGADINVRDEYGRTALILAAELGYSERVEALVGLGADINAKGKYGYTALMKAAEDGWLCSRAKIIRLLVSKGADLNAMSVNGETALAIATGRGYKWLAELLISKGADVNARRGVDGWSILMINSAYTGKKEMVELLISSGADADLKNDKGETPYDLAGNDEIRELLKEAMKKKE